MDQIKIGKFIADCRKDQKLTQLELAEILGITDRAVSKWENGRSMPDSSIMIELCNVLKISVNELLSGEKIEMNKYNEKAEKNLLEMAKKEELQNKRLMTSMWTILITSSIFYIGIILLAVNLLEEGLLLNLVIGAATILFLIAAFISLKFEVDAGYYECKNCHEKFVPTYKEVMFGTHMGTTRHLRCPKCHKKSWAKKVMTK